MTSRFWPRIEPQLQGGGTALKPLKAFTMQTQIERLMRRLTATERMAVLVSVIVMASMLSAISVDRWLRQPASPVVITLSPSAVADSSPVVLNSR
jgi:hypothetical protein